MFKNALVLHDLEELACCFIHLTPPLVTWSMRWFVDRYNESWPGIFGIPGLDEEVAFSDLFIPPTLFYVTWWLLMVIWLIF